MQITRVLQTDAAQVAYPTLRRSLEQEARMM